jgi:hypothetical protein
MTRTFVPVYPDLNQSASYRLESYVLRSDGTLYAVFGDGKVHESIYPTLEALLEAGKHYYRERVREVTA